MASGSVSSVSSSSSFPSRDIAPSGSCGLLGADKPGPRCSRLQVGRRNPTMLCMVLEALKASEKRQGTSVVAIKVYIQHKYPTVDTSRFKYLLKQALETGMRRGLFTRPANSKAKGATGSFKLVPEPKKPALQKKNQVGKAKVEIKVAPKPGQRRKLYPCSAATLEIVKPREAGKVPLKQRAPLTANIGQKAKHSGSRQAADAHGKTKDVCEKSKPLVSKVQNSVASLTKKKMATTAHTEMVVQGMKMVQKTKAPTPSQDMGHKAQPTTRVRKTKTPENTKRPESAPKTSSKAPCKKAKAGS